MHTCIYSCSQCLWMPSHLSLRPFTPSTGCIGSAGQNWKPQKTVCFSIAWLFYLPPLFLPPFFPFFISPPLNFPSPAFHPSPLPPLPPSSHIRDAERLVRAQMALACLWQWIRPPVSPFASMCKRSGQRTSNRGKRGKECEERKTPVL